MSESPPWYAVLEACRTCPGRFMAEDLAKKGIAPRTAAAWLSKLKRWGYVEVVDREKNFDRSGIQRRPKNIWSLTKAGVDCRPVEGVRSRFRRLLEAAQALKRAKSSGRGEAA